MFRLKWPKLPKLLQFNRPSFRKVDYSKILVLTREEKELAKIIMSPDIIGYDRDPEYVYLQRKKEMFLQYRGMVGNSIQFPGIYDENKLASYIMKNCPPDVETYNTSDHKGRRIATDSNPMTLRCEYDEEIMAFHKSQVNLYRAKQESELAGLEHMKAKESAMAVELELIKAKEQK